jgi:hypothetical protein
MVDTGTWLPGRKVLIMPKGPPRNNSLGFCEIVSHVIS